MARYTRTPVSTLQGINNELAKVELAMQDTLDRTGSTPNFMDANLDMNSRRILNLPLPLTDQEPLRRGDIPTGLSVSAQYVDDKLADAFALKIFQSPTAGGLTKIQTLTVNGGEVYEVRKTSDDSLATIYSDAAGTAEIVQNGTDNKSGSDGVVEFYIADGDYYIEVNSVKGGLLVSRLKPFLTVAEMTGASYLSKYAEFTRIKWQGYYSQSDGGSNWGVLRFGTHTEDGGSIFSIDSNTYIEANMASKSGMISIKKFGAKLKSEGAGFDNAPLINTMLSKKLPVRIPLGVFGLLSGVSYTDYTSIANYYTPAPPEGYPTVVMAGVHKDNSVLESQLPSFTGGDYIVQLNTNPDNLLTDAYMYNVSLEKFTIRGSGVDSLQQCLKLRGLWHASISNVKCHLGLNGIYIDGQGTFQSDDHDTCAFMNLTNVSLIDNKDSGWKSMKTRPAGINFYNCEIRNNGKFGYHGGGASVNFLGGSITLNGRNEGEGGLYITIPESTSIPRGFSVRNTTFEANHNFEIWVGYLASGVFDGVIFTPYENPNWTSNTKSIIKILEAGTTANECSFSLSNSRIQQWATTGQPLVFVATESNFGKLRVNETNTVFAGGSTQIAMSRYRFNNLNTAQWKIDDFRAVTLPIDDGTLTDITEGTNTFNSLSSKLVSSAVSDDDNTFSYVPATTSFKAIKAGLHRVTVTLPITGLSVANSDITLDIRLGTTQVVATSRLLPLPNGQYDLPITLSTVVHLPINAAPVFSCRVAGADTNPIGLAKNGTFIFSVESV